MTVSNAQLAFIFPGQGSQAVGMMRDWSDNSTVSATFAEASQVLDYDLWALVEEGPSETLDRTDCTQPAILTASVALWRLWRERAGVLPQWLAGHSLGEYSALVAAEALAFTDAVALVAERGRLMQEAVAPGEGAMAAVIGLEDEQVRAVCAEAAAQRGQVVQAVNFNAPGQVVIAGEREAVEGAGEAAEQAGAKRILPLSVSVPSHCTLMQPAAERLAERLAAIDIRQPSESMRVLHNVDVQVSRTPEEIRQRLVAQLAQPVRWSETVQQIAAAGGEVFAECGPGKVLSGLTRRIERRLEAVPMVEPDSFTALLERG
ncbi:[acyl-carrier-protein] S-malonyltransferase [Halorhodospira abdelmalekii]|uniref:ACP S-malonyltransferase n=1 Tax=Halorhodospira abdelmalekii TaxID=421629 RepID=UPI0019040B97|nr:ACP S-malonyltransferase [Halorhodospira abdelmalekii]MBK1734629.1 [acyl-carrier-protein] S-malonyltransferase [Halorhodospira abdelmalekii]